MNIYPQFITFTGIDEKTDLKRVTDLSQKYPVEWGILFSKNNTGNLNRYPDLSVVEKYFAVPNLCLSAHICGKFSRQILEDSNPNIEIADFLMWNFTRTQLNIADGELNLRTTIFPERGLNFARKILASKTIIQCTKKFPKNEDVDWLYDLSGGAGIEPDSWDAGANETNAFCGYAGGIGPENIDDIIAKISLVHPKEKPYWLDMENKVRTNDWLDLDKCEEVLRKVYG